MVRTLTFCCGLALAVASAAVCPAHDNDRTCMKLVGTEHDAPRVRSVSVQSVPSSQLGFGFMSEGSLAWVGLDESAWKTVPNWLDGTPLTLATYNTTASQVYWFCASPRCEIYVFAYDCAGCPNSTAAMLERMGTNGFDLLPCGPTVNTRTGGYTHSMMGFVKDIAAGSFTLTLGDYTEFAAFGVNWLPSARCDARTEAACEDTSNKCKWDATNEQCVLNDCTNPDGVATCTDLHCIKDDL